MTAPPPAGQRRGRSTLGFTVRATATLHTHSHTDTRCFTMAHWLGTSLPAQAFDPAGRGWGWITLDWQSNREKWLVADPNKATCEAAMAANCAALKKSGKVRRCTIYHNMQLALQW